MLSKRTVQEPDGDPGRDSRPLCLLLARIDQVDLDSRHKVTSPQDIRSLAELPGPRPQVVERRLGRETPRGEGSNEYWDMTE